MEQNGSVGGGIIDLSFPHLCSVNVIIGEQQADKALAFIHCRRRFTLCVCVCWPWVVFICAYILLRGVCVCMIVTLCVWRGHLGRICYLCCLYGLSMYACVHNKTVFGHKVCVPVCVVWCKGVDLYYSRWGDINTMTPSHCGALPSL